MAKIIRILDKIAEYTIYGLVFIIPFSKAGIEIFGSIAIGGWIGARLLKRFVPRSDNDNVYPRLPAKKTEWKQFLPLQNPIFLAIALFLFVSFLSCITSISFAHSMRALLTKTVEYLLFFLIVVDVFSEQKKIRILLSVILVSLSLLCIDGVIQHLTGVDLVRKYPLHLDYMITASFLHHNDFANYLVAFMPVLLGLAISKKTFLKYRIVMLTVFLIALFTLIYSYVRASWLAFLISMLFFALMRNKKFLVCFLSILVVGSFFLPTKVEDRLKEIDSLEAVYREYRVGIWQEAFDIIKDRPLLGWGLNSYTLVAPDYKIHPRGGIYPHNSYLHMAAEIGITGLIVFLWFLFAIFKRAMACFKQAKDEFYQLLLLGLMAGLVGFLVNAFFDTSLYALKIATTFWIMSGVLMAVSNISERNLHKKIGDINILD